MVCDCTVQDSICSVIIWNLIVEEKAYYALHIAMIKNHHYPSKSKLEEQEYSLAD